MALALLVVQFAFLHVTHRFFALEMSLKILNTTHQKWFQNLHPPQAMIFTFTFVPNWMLHRFLWIWKYLHQLLIGQNYLTFEQIGHYRLSQLERKNETNRKKYPTTWNRFFFQSLTCKSLKTILMLEAKIEKW